MLLGSIFKGNSDLEGTLILAFAVMIEENPKASASEGSQLTRQNSFQKHKLEMTSALLANRELVGDVLCLCDRYRHAQSMLASSGNLEIMLKESLTYYGLAC